MVALGRPKSTTGHSWIRIAAVGRAAAGRQVRARSRSRSRSRRRPGRRARPAGSGTPRPKFSRSTFDPGASRSAISSTIRTRSAPRWRLLKRMLSCAVAAPGMRLVAPAGVEMSVNSRFDGGKASLPSSRWIASSAATSRASGGDRIVGAVGVSDMALRAGNLDPHVDRSAPADLDRVAEPRFRGRLADQDHVGTDLALAQPVDDRAACRRSPGLPRRR